MKIALIKRRCSLKAGGSERYCVNLSRELTSRGHEVTVIGHQIDEELAGEIDFISVPINRLSSAHKNRSFARNAGQAARSGGFDVVYALGRSYGVDAVRVTERLQSHWVNVNYQQPLNSWWQKRNPRHTTLIQLEREIYSAQSTRRIVTQSKLDHQLVQKYYQIEESKLRTIYNGVNLKQFHPDRRERREELRKELGVSESCPVFLFASMDFEGKGLRTILASLAECEHSEATLIVLGTGPVKRFQKLAQQLGISDRVMFLGRRSDIPDFYAMSDLFLLPTEYEPFPNVNLEAMACGTPVITTTTSGGADILQPGVNGFLMTDRHAQADLTAGMNQFLQLTGEQKSQMQQQCRQTACEYPLEKNVEQTLSLFEELAHAA